MKKIEKGVAATQYFMYEMHLLLLVQRVKYVLNNERNGNQRWYNVYRTVVDV